MKIGDLQETADLAHLNLGEEELAAAFPAFEQMLGYFAAMQVADQDGAAFHTEGMAASSRLVPAAYFRGDTVNPANANPPEDLQENMLAKAGERDGRFVVIPNVL
jgi:aspartyl-tRNA(Asn)/glutamyl-tRNA(Gln) amidotransferase subunit C